jgi:hypothetical protein
MGYGDLFIAGTLGGLLAATGDGVRQRGAAVLAALLALLFDLLFFLVNELPATVPVALTLVLMQVARQRRASTGRTPVTAGLLGERRPGSGPLKRRQRV